MPTEQANIFLRCFMQRDPRASSLLFALALRTWLTMTDCLNKIRQMAH